MKERPILFSTEMVQAILDGRKTMTRRCNGLEEINQHADKWKYGHGSAILPGHFWFCDVPNPPKAILCPYGQPGDILWVREKFRPLHNCETGEFVRMDFYADMPAKFHQQYPHTYKPSIHMPKAAARIYLQVESVRVERLQDITEQDAISEGSKSSIRMIDYIETCKKLGDYILPSPLGPHKNGFMHIWVTINGADSWKANPWVWVISFKVLSTTGRPDFSKPKP